MNLLGERFRLLVACPCCQRPVHLTPGPAVLFTADGHVGYDRDALEDALRLHLRLGCDRT